MYLSLHQMLSTVYSVTTTELHKPNSQKRQTFPTIFFLPPVRVLAFHLPVHIVLELLHVEELEGLVVLEQPVGQLQDVVGEGRLLQGLACTHLQQYFCL